MDLISKKLAVMAEHDGVSTEKFIKFAKELYDAVVKHSPSGSFLVLLPKTGYRHPVSVCIDLPYEDDEGIELAYRLRDCVPGWRTVTIFDQDGTRPQVLVVKASG